MQKDEAKDCKEKRIVTFIMILHKESDIFCSKERRKNKKKKEEEEETTNTQDDPPPSSLPPPQNQHKDSYLIKDILYYLII